MPNLVRPIVEGKNRKVFRAYLAEEYDGIGQYVAVSLARSGVTSALRAKISIGDVGNDVKYPPGTPLLVFSDHGLLEIISFGGPDPLASTKECSALLLPDVIFGGSAPSSFINTGSMNDGNLDPTKYSALHGTPINVGAGWVLDLGTIRTMRSLRLVSTSAFPFFIPTGNLYTDPWDGFFQFLLGQTYETLASHSSASPIGLATDAFIDFGLVTTRYVAIERNAFNGDGPPTRFELVEAQLSACAAVDWFRDVKGYDWNSFT